MDFQKLKFNFRNSDLFKVAPRFIAAISFYSPENFPRWFNASLRIVNKSIVAAHAIWQSIVLLVSFEAIVSCIRPSPTITPDEVRSPNLAARGEAVKFL